MNELSLGIWLRRERERRGITLRQIAEQTKVSVPLLEGLEADDLARWPAGIYRKAFVRSYAASVGLDADEVVKRFEREHPAEPDSSGLPATTVAPPTTTEALAEPAAPPRGRGWRAGRGALVLGATADLTVALVIGLGSAAAGSRLLWPVLAIALYYALGTLLTGTTPMVALLSDGVEEPAARTPTRPEEPPRMPRPQPSERRPTSRRVARAQRASKPPRPRVQ